MTLKEKIHQHYCHLLSGKIKMVQQVLTDLKESGANETKSTAGDKHETALAMLQIEQANKRNQLQELQLQLNVLNRINPALKTEVILTGSLVKTNRGFLFISIAAGKATVEDCQVIALSIQSPLGQKMAGLKAGSCVTINNMEYNIETVE